MAVLSKQPKPTPDAGRLGDMRADALSVSHTCPLSSLNHQTAGGGNPCPLLQHGVRLKDEQTEKVGVMLDKSSHTVCRNNKSPPDSGRAGKLRRTSTV